jgi:succinyl-diaminopimelate desuccinylase
MEKVFSNLDASKADLVKAIQTVIGFHSVKGDPQPGAPFGKENKDALDFALAEAKKLGFTVKNLDGYCGYAEYGVGEEYVAVLGHLDIVPLGKGWTSPPLEGKIVKNCIVGRGAIDDKGPIFAALYALAAIKDAGITLKHRIRVIFGCDEEVGMSDMEHYLKHEPAPCFGFTPDSTFPVTYGEKGHVNIFLSAVLGEQPATNVIVSIGGGDTMNVVPDYAEATVRVTDPSAFIALAQRYTQREKCQLTAESGNGNEVVIKVKGRPAHAMEPAIGDNAVSRLCAFLVECQLGGTLAEFIGKINTLLGRECDGQSLGIACSDEVSGGLTLNFSRIICKNRNVEVGCDIRVPVTSNPETIAEKIKTATAALGLKLDIPEITQPLYYPKDSFLVTTLTDIFCRQFGKDVAPMTTGGGTYAKTMPNTVAFGMAFPGGISKGEHEADEKLDLDELTLATKILAEAMIKLAQ